MDFGSNACLMPKSNFVHAVLHLRTVIWGEGEGTNWLMGCNAAVPWTRATSTDGAEFLCDVLVTVLSPAPFCRRWSAGSRSIRTILSATDQPALAKTWVTITFDNDRNRM